MSSLLSIKRYLAVNRGRYFRRSMHLPEADCSVYLTVHAEIASTDLLHYHDRPHLSFVINGGVIDKRRHSEMHRAAGELMYFHAGEPHQSIYFGFPVRNINIEFADGFFTRNGLSEDVLTTALDVDATKKLTMLHIYRELMVCDEDSETSLEMHLLKLAQTPLVSPTRPVWFEHVIDLINDKWNQSISLSEIAKAAGVHPKTVSKAFPHYLKCTFGEYRRQIKIGRSISMIKNRKLTLTGVAHECGFYDQSHFTETFKTMTGFRPSEFRKM